MSSNCIFALDHPNAVYYSGQTINGTINLTTAKDKNVRHVRILFLGEGKVKWNETISIPESNGYTTTYTAHSTYYTSHEVYVNNETYVRGEGTLPMGLHTYTFSIPLPMQCPTSCEGRFGHIRYSLSLILDRPLRFNNVHTMPLTVLQTVDLNLNPIFKLPLLAEEVGSLCYWNCASGKIMYALRVPFGAYSPGQMVKYSLSIQNKSMANTDGYLVEFTQKMAFNAYSPSHRQRQKKIVLVQQSSLESCPRLSNRIFDGQFRIPSVPPTTEPSSIICITYILKLTVGMPGCHNSQDMSVPIFIGNIPLWESLTSSLAPGPEGTQIAGTAPSIKDTGNSDMPPSYYDLKPPSYQATMQGDSPFVDDDVDKHHRVVGFRPLYPMYT